MEAFNGQQRLLSDAIDDPVGRDDRHRAALQRLFVLGAGRFATDQVAAAGVQNRLHSAAIYLQQAPELPDVGAAQLGRAGDHSAEHRLQPGIKRLHPKDKRGRYEYTANRQKQQHANGRLKTRNTFTGEVCESGQRKSPSSG